MWHTLVCLLNALHLCNPLTRFIGPSTNTGRVTEVASLGRHPSIQGLGCLEMEADAAKIVNISFPLHYSDLCRCRSGGEF